MLRISTRISGEGCFTDFDQIITDFSYKHGICSLRNGKCNFVPLPGWGICTHFKAPRGVLVKTAQPHRGAFAAFPKKNDKYPINARGDGHVFN